MWGNCLHKKVRIEQDAPVTVVELLDYVQDRNYTLSVEFQSEILSVSFPALFRNCEPTPSEPPCGNFILVPKKSATRERSRIK
jgi:hypothetical protein